MKRFLLTILALTFFLSVFGAPSAPKDQLAWNAEEGRVDADIQSWKLETALEKISAAAGWEVYLEPGTSQNISVKFSNLPVDDALKRLLGKLSFALLPQTNAAPKFYVFRTSMGHATQLISRPAKKSSPDNPDLIPDELIVTLKPESGITIEELAKMLGAKIVGRDDKNHTYRLKFEDEEAAEIAREKLNNNVDVASVDSNYYMHPQPPVSQLPIASSIPFSLNPTPKNDPNNTIVGLIDSPVQSLGPEMDKFILSQLSVMRESAKSDQPMHGTFMAEAVLQALQKAVGDGTSNVKIQPVDVYGWSSTTTTFEIGKGIQLAVENGASIINLSLGTYGDNRYLEKQIQNLRNKGIIFFASAGNEPVAQPVFPAAYLEVSGVTAGINNKLDPYANRFPGNDMMMPGKSLGQFKGTAYLVSGTSSSSALAAGTAAAAISKGGSAGKVESMLRKEFPPARE